MADPTIIPDDESKKDTVRINLPPGVMGQSATAKPVAEDQSKRDTAAIGAEQAKKETAMMGMPAEAKKDTSRVAVPAAKPTIADMPRPTVRLRREPGAGSTVAPTTPSAARASVPEMPRPTVKLKVEESVAAAPPAPATASGAAPAPVLAPAPAPVPMEAASSGLETGLAILATVMAAAVLAYLVVASSM